MPCTRLANCHDHATGCHWEPRRWMPLHVRCGLRRLQLRRMCHELRAADPNCTASQCSIATHCNNHATQVSGTSVTGCRCTCASNYVGASCNACGPNYESYPTCSATPCTVASNCNDHATSVNGTLASGCTCACAFGFAGVRCQDVRRWVLQLPRTALHRHQRKKSTNSLRSRQCRKLDRV